MDNRIKELFDRYQSGKATEVEKKIVEDWFARFGDEFDAELNQQHQTGLFNRMDDSIANLLADYHRKSWLDNRWLQAAAILIVALTATLFIYLRQGANQLPTVTYSFLKSPNGVKKAFVLTDGTTVYLNSGSSIRLPSNFGLTSREIALNGEAFFVVKHDAAKPFVIHSGKLLITDLGTAFNVKAYADYGKIQVAVESGKVKIEQNSTHGKPVLFANAVTPNQLFTYDLANGIYNVASVQPNDLIGWRQNRLRFENASFNEIAHTLERWYDVTINLNGSDKSCRMYTVSFNNEPIDHVLNVLANLSGIDYQIHNKAITINLKKCKTMK
ncbi:FecR family protein [Mucilaginibacter paludis]|uniref:Anti-FecI sigma factor, FecR n=1 Tax=Mucilaginibacter paludis DSM 18603 TaxID=714943 RepID=H1Y5U7_9SPHI|nr:FecR family protein [Mucilaginibacter paludis]EHQ30369.1 anti-FecI sigma factor, FecR [Mucilaginibacter paludis DSM 18603]